MARPGALRRSLTPRLAVSLAASLAVHGVAVALLFDGGRGPGASAPEIVFVDLATTAETSAQHGGEPPPAAPSAEQLQALAQANGILEQESEALRSELAAERERSRAVESEYREQLAAATAEVEAARAETAEARTESTEVRAESDALRTENTELHARIAGERDRATALARELEAERVRRQEALAEQRRAHAQLVAALRDEIAGKDVALREATQGLTLSISDRVLFPSGQATLTHEGQKLVDKLARALADVRERRILIEGHTDNVPIGPDLRSRFPSNWELSTARAGEVVRQLTTRGGIPAERLLAAGRADTEPAASNETEEGRQQNRRIEIILLPATPAAAEDRG
jgi:chemotaxis protein MotB